MSEDEKLTERLLLDKGMWSSKTLWKAVSGVAISVFILTMIYAQFLSMGKDILFMKDTHAAEIKVLTDRIRTQNDRLVKADDNAEAERDINASEIILLKLDAHEPAAGQKRIHR